MDYPCPLLFLEHLCPLLANNFFQLLLNLKALLISWFLFLLVFFFFLLLLFPWINLRILCNLRFGSLLFSISFNIFRFLLVY